jgi:hypothetical protein
MAKTDSTPTTSRTVAAIMAGAVAPLPLAPSPRGRTLLRLMRHRTRYLDLFNAADIAGDGAAAHAWDMALIRLEADIAAVGDDIRARPIFSVANIVDRAIVASHRGEAQAFVAELVRDIDMGRL